MYRFLKSKNLYERFLQETRRRLGEKYFIKGYCLTECDELEISEAEKRLTIVISEDPWENVKRIVKRELRLQRYGLSYVPGTEIIVAFERARDVEKIEKKLGKQLVEYYDAVIRNAILAVINAGVVGTDATVEDIVTGRRKVYTLEELEEKEEKTMQKIKRKIESSKYREEILEVFTRKTPGRRGDVAYSGSGRTGKIGKGGGIKNIKKAIAMTAIARS